MAWQSGTLWSWLDRLLPRHGEGVLLVQKGFPGQGPRALEQILEGTGGELPQQQKHPLPKPAAQVGPGQQLRPAGEQHPAVFRPDVFTPQLPQLLRRQALYPHQAGGRSMSILP